MHNNYGFGKTVAGSFDDAVAKVTQELGKEGFGVLTEIDVAATLKKKLNRDMPPYKILGACNPPFAAQALDAEPSIGLLMPCNVIVQDLPSGGVEVAAINPEVGMQTIGNPALSQLAAQVREKLARVIERL